MTDININDETANAVLAQVETNMTDFVPPAMSAWRRRLIMLSLCLTLFLSALDITIISTALPTIARELGVNGRQYAWISSGFTLSSTASTPVWAKASDIFGRRPAVIASAACFMAGSLVCALAVDCNMLIGGRVVQGLGCGGSVVMVTIIIGDIFSLKDRPKYYGFTGIVWGISSAVGPVLGGIFVQTIGWRWCFYINLPFDGLAIMVLLFALKVDIEREPILQGLRTLDWTGFALIIGGTISFLYGLELGATNTLPWSAPVVICTMAIGGLLLAAFTFWEARFASKPIIPGRIFSRSTNMAAFVLACLHSFVFISYDFFLPLYSQVILGLSPLLSGVTLFALIVPLSSMPMVGALVIRKTGNYVYICYLGAALMALGNGLFLSFKTDREWAKIISFQVITGIGAGLLFQSPMIALQSFLHQSDLAAAMSAYSFLRNLCTSISVVIGSVLIQHSLPGGSSFTSLHASHDTKTGGEVEESVSKQQYLTGLRNMWTFYTAICGLMLLSAFFIKQKRPDKKTEEATDKPNVPIHHDREDEKVTNEKEIA
ncbi:related to DHA14-like major facilitator efflux transporter (MFS transporter) [Ustilago trichophora]|uniref:Related to DHA14-like major facilitator efflux transporter (MFS transporter) n=1 Tax=Ustilago trichophora TaxID=86804 RepID=A0A5C3ECA3_9BASI|nr:related to DHA14-like major facilitator efflux transporter (MFS transporter) [Ustilago trichophora]